MGFDTTLLVAGAILGLAFALLGGWLDYRGMRSGIAGRDHDLPPLIMPVLGFLSLVGIVAFAVSLIVTGGVRPAVVAGLGVGLGFVGGFALLSLVYLFTHRS